MAQITQDEPLSVAEENYLKGIYFCEEKSTDPEGIVSTNEISDQLATKPASVTDMLKRLAQRGYIDYERYYGAKLTHSGRKAALEVIRRHRLWECFLVTTLNFKWDEVHEVAEQLEHVQSKLLTERLDAFLGSPQYDPHGDPIPSAEGVVPAYIGRSVSDLQVGDSVIMMGVSDSSSPFLQHLDTLKIGLGTTFTVTAKNDFDGAVTVLLGKDKQQMFFSEKTARSILTQPFAK